MKIALPIAEGKLCMHFGHCSRFAVVDVDEQTQDILATELLTPPPHAPGVLPKWLAENGVGAVIAGGMGMRAQQIFADNGIDVFVGAPAAAPEDLVRAHLSGTLVTGENVCDH